MSSTQRLYNPHAIFDPNAYWPIVSYGECVKKQNHSYKQDGWLGDGICVNCWDNGHKSSREKTHNEMTRSENQLQKHPNGTKQKSFIQLQNAYDDAVNAWEKITKDEDPKMLFGGLKDFDKYSPLTGDNN